MKSHERHLRNNEHQWRNTESPKTNENLVQNHGGYQSGLAFICKKVVADFTQDTKQSKHGTSRDLFCSHFCCFSLKCHHPGFMTHAAGWWFSLWLIQTIATYHSLPKFSLSRIRLYNISSADEATESCDGRNFLEPVHEKNRSTISQWMPMCKVSFKIFLKLILGPGDIFWWVSKSTV